MAEFTRLPMFMFCPDLLVCLHTVGHPPRIIHHCKIKQRYYTKISKCIQTFISPQNQQKLAVSFDIFESPGIGKDKLRKFLLNTIDSKTPFGERLPPVRRPYMQRKQTSNFWQRATTAVLVGPNSSMACPPPSMPQTENLCIYVWKGRYLSFICALLSCSWVPPSRVPCLAGAV